MSFMHPTDSEQDVPADHWLSSFGHKPARWHKRETERERDYGIISGSLCQQERPWVTTDPTPRRSSVFVYIRQPTPSYCCPQIFVLSG
jgi:hypothetical protein